MTGQKIDVREAANTLRGFYFVNRRMPTFKEMMRLFNYASRGGVSYAIDRLVEKGYLERDAAGKIVPAKISGDYPILGSIQAGFPSPAEEELIDTISLDQFLVKKPQATYLVKVSGDSMIGAGIMPGDIVMVERGKIPKHGDVVIAEVDGAWTMKHLEKKGKQVRLLAANPKYPPIEPHEELKISGVVIGVVRKY